MAMYVAVMEPAESGGHGVWFPDFPGCVSAGHDFKEAFHNAAEALELHVQGMTEDGEAIPPPTRLTALADIDFSRNYPFVVQVEIPEAREPKVIRVNMTLPEPLVQRIDKVANNRSAWLAEAAREKLAQVAPSDDILLERLARARERVAAMKD